MFFKPTKRNKTLTYAVAAMMVARMGAFCLCHAQTTCEEEHCQQRAKTHEIVWQAEHSSHGQHDCAFETLPDASISWHVQRLATSWPVFAEDARTGVWIAEARRLKPPRSPQKPPPGLVLKMMSQKLC